MEKKCYIAGKIGDKSVEQYTKDFEKGKQDAKALGYIPVSPLDLPHDHDKSWESYMKEDLAEMMKCDAVLLLKDWKKSPGARIEAGLAFQLGLTILKQ